MRVGATVTLALAAAATLVLLAAGAARSPKRPAAPVASPTRGGPARLASIQTVRGFTIGRSVRGRRIDAVELAAPAPIRSVLVVGCIHGNEPAGIAIAQKLLGAAPPARTALWIIPDLNPDGVKADTRQNADRVDLNRNFPWHWRPLDAP